MDKNTKKELLNLFKQMLESGEMKGKFGDLHPTDNGYEQTEWTITIEKKTRAV